MRRFIAPLLALYWPTTSQYGELRLASERALIIFCLLGGVSGLGITAINFPLVTEFPLTIGLGGVISIVCLVGPPLFVGRCSFSLIVRLYGYFVLALLVSLSILAEELVGPSNLLLIPAVLTMTLALGWRDGMVAFAAALTAFSTAYLTSSAEWSRELTDVNVQAIFAAQALASLFVFAGSGAFREQMVSVAEHLAEQTDLARAATQSKSEFLASVTHEIRTPLNGVLGMAEYLGQTDLDAEQSKCLSAIVRSGRLLNSTLNDVLDLSQIEAGRLSIDLAPFMLSTLIEDLEVVYRQVAQEEGLSFRVLIHGDLDEKERHLGDVNRIAQILHNLLSNAFKFTERGGVFVDVKRVEGEQTLEFIVSDTGIGMSEAQSDVVFDKFVQADQSIARKFGGTGLGLSIVTRLVQLMDGEVEAESNQAVGSRFKVCLPLATVGAEAQDDVPSHSAAPNYAEISKVLVVDDVTINRQVMKGLLSSLGVAADYADSGAAALDAYYGNKYAGVFLDISMPGMSGFDVIDKIRAFDAKQNRAPIRVIALTANVMAHHIEQYGAAGFDSVIAKPIDLTTLKNELGRLIA